MIEFLYNHAGVVILTFLFLKGIFSNLTYREIRLSCGSFKVKRRFATPEVIIRIVNREFFPGKRVDPAIMKEIYDIYGPLSYDGLWDLITRLRARYRIPRFCYGIMVSLYRRCKRIR